MSEREEGGRDLSRRQFVGHGGRIIVGTALTVAGSGVLLGCGGGKTTQEDVPLEFYTVSRGQFISRVTPDSSQHFDAETGRLLPYCPEVSFDRWLTPGDNIDFEMSFQGEDSEALEGCGESGYQIIQPISSSAYAVPYSREASRLSREPGYAYKDFGFFVTKTGRVEMHPLRPCVEQDVLHTHVYVKRDRSVPDQEALFEFHLGKYRPGNEICYVLYDSKHPWICAKGCTRDETPTNVYNILKKLFEIALAAGFLALSIRVAPWLIPRAAGVLAGALRGTALAL